MYSIYTHKQLSLASKIPREPPPHPLPPSPSPPAPCPLPPRRPKTFSHSRTPNCYWFSNALEYINPLQLLQLPLPLPLLLFCFYSASFPLTPSLSLPTHPLPTTPPSTPSTPHTPFSPSLSLSLFYLLKHPFIPFPIDDRISEFEFTNLHSFTLCEVLRSFVYEGKRSVIYIQKIDR